MATRKTAILSFLLGISMIWTIVYFLINGLSLTNIVDKLVLISSFSLFTFFIISIFRSLKKQ